MMDPVFRPDRPGRVVSAGQGDGFFMFPAALDNPDAGQLHLLLEASAARHSHLCPRQVLGVRLALAGIGLFDPAVFTVRKRLLVISEMDGCFVDGVEVAAHVSVGLRTLRIEDFGKVAATFVDCETGQALRLSPYPDLRQRAGAYAGQSEQAYEIQLHAYQRMPATEMFRVQAVTLKPTLESILSRHGPRATCSLCGEEIINEREVLFGTQVLCRPCAGRSYYTHPQNINHPK